MGEISIELIITKQVKHIISVVILALLCGCSTNKTEKNEINKAFSTDSKKETNNGYFSPLRFAGKQNLSQANVTYTTENSALMVTSSKNKTQVGFNPIRVTYSSKDSITTTSYPLIIYNSDGYMEGFGDLSYAFDRQEQNWLAIDYGNWAPDILCDTTSMELWKRWVQFAAFTPILRDPSLGKQTKRDRLMDKRRN